jgi:hypothetical protein
MPRTAHTAPNTPNVVSRHDFLQPLHVDIYIQEVKAFPFAIILCTVRLLMLANDCEPEEKMFAMECKLESVQCQSSLKQLLQTAAPHMPCREPRQGA